MKPIIRSLLTIAACAPLVTQAAIIDGYGVAASTSTASNCPSFCTSANGGDFQYDSDGGEFSTYATSTETSYGVGQAEAIYTGSTTTYLPELRVLASSDAGRQGRASVIGIQGYTYSGAATTITLNFNLHGDVVDNDNGSYTNNTLRADIAVVLLDTMEFYTDFGTLIFEEVGTSNIVDNTPTSLFHPGGIDQDVFGSISFDVVDGMDFFVVASMDAVGQNGVVDAWNTLSMDFTDDTGLAAAATVIPVPAAVWLFASGLLGLVGVARLKP